MKGRPGKSEATLSRSRVLEEHQTDIFLKWILLNGHRHERSLIQVWPVRRRCYPSSIMRYHVCATACRGHKPDQVSSPFDAETNALGGRKALQLQEASLPRSLQHTRGTSGSIDASSLLWRFFSARRPRVRSVTTIPLHSSSTGKSRFHRRARRHEDKIVSSTPHSGLRLLRQSFTPGILITVTPGNVSTELGRDGPFNGRSW